MWQPLQDANSCMAVVVVSLGLSLFMVWKRRNRVATRSVWYYIARRLDKAVIFGVERLPRIGV